MRNEQRAGRSWVQEPRASSSHLRRTWGVGNRRLGIYARNIVKLVDDMPVGAQSEPRTVTQLARDVDDRAAFAK
jgi:hypothetical protein